MTAKPENPPAFPAFKICEALPPGVAFFMLNGKPVGVIKNLSERTKP